MPWNEESSRRQSDRRRRLSSGPCFRPLCVNHPPEDFAPPLLCQMKPIKRLRKSEASGVRIDAALTDFIKDCSKDVGSSAMKVRMSNFAPELLLNSPLDHTCDWKYRGHFSMRKTEKRALVPIALLPFQEEEFTPLYSSSSFIYLQPNTYESHSALQ